MTCCPQSQPGSDLALYATKIYLKKYIETALVPYVSEDELTAILTPINAAVDALGIDLADVQSSLADIAADYVSQANLNPLVKSVMETVTPTVTTPTLQNGWQNFGGGYSTAGYYRFAGRIWLTGTLKNTTTTELTRAFFLSDSSLYPAAASTQRGDSGMGQDCRVHSYTDGSIWFQTTFRGYVCIDGVSILAPTIISG